MRNTTFKDKVLRVVAILGLIALLLLGAWGIIQIAFWLPTLFSDIRGNIGGMFNREPSAESITMSIPAGVTAGTAFSVNWRHQGGNDAHTYSLAYQCREGVSFDASLPDGKTESIKCNTPFAIAGATSSIQLTPRLAKDAKTTPVGFSVAATKVSTGVIVATTTGGTVVSPAPAAAPAATIAKPKPAASTGSAPASTYYASGRTANLYGYPDLHVAINAAYAQAGRAAVQFTVTNVGTNVSPAQWYFTARLPIGGGYTYQSPTQQALYPGDRIVFTMGYDSFLGGSPYEYQTQCGGFYGSGCWYGTSQGSRSQTVSITVDPYNLVPEINEINNTASRSYWSY